MSRLLTTFAASTLSVLLVIPAAVAKEGVRAKLVTPVPLQAAPGETIPITWTLSYSDRGARHRFGASGVFVRLLSASGGAPVKASGTEERARDRSGRYVAEVRVPEGGIGGIRIGLEGIRIIGGRTEDADVFFPIDNDPFATAAASGGNTGDSRSFPPSAGGGKPLPILLLAAGALAASGAILRRRMRTAKKL